MATTEELIRVEENGAISFGNYSLAEKAKADHFPHGGDLYKVKTYQKLTKLEKNEMFLYESVPGTNVKNFTEKQDGVTFDVEGNEDAQIIIGLEDDTEYEVSVAGNSIGKIMTNLGGKLNISVELAGEGSIAVAVTK